MMAMDISTPPTTSPSKRHSPNMSLDFSDLPPLSTPTPPSNTLLITGLASLEIFTSSVLESISKAINEHATIHIFAPLKSFVRVYFGSQTKIGDEEKYLHLPKSDKLFFISPPPSPPMGWQMRDEEPPNKDVHAEDLAHALSKLQARPGPMDAMDLGNTGLHEPRPITGRARSGTGTVVYHPEDHGDSPALPAIEVEDTTETPGDVSPMEGVDVKFPHTARPPVELM
jgi:hypothetical protein